MNLENLTQLRDHLKKMPEDAREFDMSDWCGTTCCIAGHAYWLAMGRPASSDSDVRARAQKWLGLTEDEAQWLFIGRFQLGEYLSNVRPPHAVAALDHLIADGAVKEGPRNDWFIISEAEPL